MQTKSKHQLSEPSKPEVSTMNTAKQSQTPNTPAFPQEPPAKTTGKLQPNSQMPLSNICEELQSGDMNKNTRTSSSIFAKSRSIVLNGTLNSATIADTRLNPRLTIYYRRTLRRRQTTSQASTNQARYYRQFAHLLRPLQPLVSIETGLPHPSFPQNMLQYHLLSHAQLDALANHYHQSSPSYYSLGYPTTVVGRWWSPSFEYDDTMSRDQHYEALIEEAKGILRQIGPEGLDEAIIDLGSNDGSECEDLDVGRKEKDEEDKEGEAPETILEDKRRRFGRFIGLRDCESPGPEDERMMESAMEAWVWGEVERRARLDEDCEVRIGKRGW